jgi:hypothetical protein
MAPSETERKNWVNALTQSMKTAREMQHGRIRKNIDGIIHIYDSAQTLPERRERLRAKMREDIARIQKLALGV